MASGTSGFLVEPRGNAYMIDRRTCQDDFINAKQGLGQLMHAVGGVETVNERVFVYLQAQDLCNLACASRALWTLVEADENLWRDLALAGLSLNQLDARILLLKQQQQEEKKSVNLWKMVAINNFCALQRKQQGGGFGRLFCDALLRPLQCARGEIKPDWISRTNVTRVHMNDLSVDDFVHRFESKRLPVVITTDGQLFAQGIVRWRKGLEHGMSTLTSTTADRRFRAGPATLSGSAFAAYSSMFADETPLYIFDSEFGEKYPVMASNSDYEVPPYFTGEGRDLFERFPGTTKANVRPDYRWIIAGPAKSGSKWHVDPNCTHAWNVSLLGRKKWILLPPGQAPPVGVYPSQDGGEVAQPVSLVEWFLEFYKETKRQRGREMIEFVADVGDIVFVPSGWWHCVLNLDESFAITQNYVARTNLPRVLRFFQEKPDQISGLRRAAPGCADRRDTFRQEFMSLLRAEDYKGVVVVAADRRDAAPEEEEEKKAETTAVSWSALIAEKKSDTATTFKFSFGAA